ncbi:hypothetical protein GGR52DRAFT_539865 [Hypoxylon sp. FL1284]|nr:hypothetical protein GGR52DRAFT_539865 [Hypoxylon sp. FL1284]
MSHALAAQCHRAAQRRVRPQHDGIWISEALLAATFERFCLTSKTTTRHGSFVPGPMENRRRMGRRHMGELNFGHSHSAAPLWGLENLANLTQWRWKPPSSPDARSRERWPEEARAWLVGLFGPTTTTRPPNLKWDARSATSEVVDAGLNCLRRDVSSSATTQTWHNFKSFCDSWKDAVMGGYFSGDRICSTLDGIQRVLSAMKQGDEELLAPLTISKLELNLLQATIEGLTNSDNHSDCFVWDSILHRVSGLQINSITIFKTAMSHIPDFCLRDMSASISANLRTYLSASRRHSQSSTLARQASRMAQPLKRLDLNDQLGILESGTLFVLSNKDSNEEVLHYPRIRLAWLYLLARLPWVSEKYLAAVCFTLEAGKSVRPLSKRSICELYLLKHRSSTRHEAQLFNALEKNHGRENSVSESYSNLCMAAWQTGQFHVIRGLCEFLQKLGREQDIMSIAMGLRNLIKNEATPLVNVALGARQPELAIEILGLYQEHSGGPTYSKKTKFLTEAVKTLTRSQSVSQDRILTALDLVHPSRRKRRRRTETAPKQQLLNASTAARAFAHAPWISNRTSLRLISRCIRYLQAGRRGAVLPTPTLRAVLYNVTRDLAEGKAGRTARLRWVLGLFQRHDGHERMLQVESALRRWREVNDRRRR